MTIQATFAPTTSRQRPPKPETVANTASMLLNRMVHDRPMEASCGMSTNGYHFVRLEGHTNGVSWQVDVYRCRHFVVSAVGRRGITTNNFLTVLTYLQAATV